MPITKDYIKKGEKKKKKYAANSLFWKLWVCSNIASTILRITNCYSMRSGIFACFLYICLIRSAMKN